ncbi:hypothetical protein BJ742DRAFT_792276 [Cladochytrium replicatum]|nr:hypothetical protein BJ742DRAFT_792276 [Cladochytrium replicatum]
MTQDFDAVVGFTPQEFESGIDLIFYISMAIIPINLFGSFYVLMRVLTATFHSRPRVIPQSLRLPFYVVFVDVLCSLTFTAEMIHLYFARQTPEPPISRILGGCVTFVIICNFVLITQAAFNSWNRVVRKKPVDTGRYDWKLLLPTIAVPGTVVAIFASIEALGANNYFSWIRKSAKGAAVFVGVAVLISLFAIWIFYVSIMSEIFKVSRGSFLKTIISYEPTKNTIAAAAQAAAERAERLGSNDAGQGGGSGNQRSGNSTSSQLTALERQAIIKICMYMMACFFQYLPGCPYALSFLAPSQPFALYCLAVVSINSGGIFNGLALILNEGFGVTRKGFSGNGSSVMWMHGEAPSANPSISAGGSNRSNFSISIPSNAFGISSSNWSRTPSHRGIPLSNFPNPRGGVVSASIMNPQEQSAVLHESQPRDPLRSIRASVNLGVPSQASQNTSSFDAIWERHVASQVSAGPTVAPWIPPTNPEPLPLPTIHEHNSSARNSQGLDHSVIERSSHATRVDLAPKSLP